MRAVIQYNATKGTGTVHFGWLQTRVSPPHVFHSATTWLRKKGYRVVSEWTRTEGTETHPVFSAEVEPIRS